MQRRRISSYISALASKASAAIPTRASLAIPTRYAEVLALSLLLLGGLASPAHAQSKAKKMVEQPDTVPLFRGMAVSVDAIGLGQMVLGSYGQYEAALRINLKDKYFPVLELGYGKADATDDGTNLHYKTSAPYARIGVDWNLLRNKHDIYRLYGGVRYAFTTYKYDVEGPDITDPIWGTTTPYSAKDVSCNCHWLEGCFGIDVKIWGPIRMGWSVRYKRRIAHKEGDIGKAWYAPGFGKQGSSRLGGTFNIGYEF